MPKRLLRALVPLLAAGLFLLCLVALGRAALERLRGRDRAAFAFADIECAPPPGLDRREFLDQVQYLAGLPDRLPLLDDGLAERLAGAFARHPWVEKVERVEVPAGGRVRVGLTYREPVLAVPHAGALRAVDRHGVLMPRNAPTEGLPVFQGSARPPAGDSGTPWGDAAVEEAARAAARPN